MDRYENPVEVTEDETIEVPREQMQEYILMPPQQEVNVGVAS